MEAKANPEGQKNASTKAERLLEGYTRQELKEKGFEKVINLLLESRKENQQLQKELDLRTKELQRCQKGFLNLQCTQQPRFKYQGYDKTKGWVYKLCFILERHGQKMTFKELKDVILSLESDLMDRWINLDNYLSQILHSACVRGAVERIKSKRERGYYYTLSRE